MTDVLVTGMDLKLARIRQQVTATALARKMGVSRPYLSQVESRYAVQPEMANRYREALASFPSLASPSDGQEAS